MPSAALRPARNWNQHNMLAVSGLATLLLCPPWLTACTAASSAGTSGTSANPQLSGNLFPANVGVPYNGTITVSGGKAPYVFRLSSGSLPAGLTLNQATGTVSGTPGKTGVFPFAVQATDSTGIVGAQSFQIPVSTPGTIAVTVTPAISTLTSTGTMQYTALVSNTSNAAVTWTASPGTITSSGLYQAPTVTTNTVATVTATSSADSTKSGKALLTITP